MAQPNRPDGPFDRRLRRLRRDRAAAGGDDGRYLLRRMADELLERLAMVRREFRRALVVGFTSEFLVDRLRRRGIEVVAADAGYGFARIARGIQCDEDRLPVAEAAFDLIVAVGTLDSVNDLPGALILARRALRPDGLLLAAFAGAGSLPRLRRALRAAEEAEELAASPRLHPQVDVRAAGDLLSRAGFAIAVVDCETITVRFSSLLRLVADLRAMGATNVLAARSRHSFGKRALAAACADFAARAEADGRTAEHFSLLYLAGWSPAPDQPKPAQRGSGTVSLAKALEQKDQRSR